MRREKRHGREAREKERERLIEGRREIRESARGIRERGREGERKGRGIVEMFLLCYVSPIDLLPS
jgi:uncharacterized membrane protein YkvA (DUF1232 family)